MADPVTPNFGLVLPPGNRRNWTDLANGNTRIIDALIATYVSVSNLQGLWTNNTQYTTGQNVVDETSGVVYTAQVDHTSSSAPTTFLEERTNHPTYWLTFAVAARNRGTWQPSTAYALNDFVLADGTKYAMCIEAHTSGANFTTDEAAGKWEVMIDLSVVGSLVLPVLGGAVDANKVVMSDGGGNSYIINTIASLIALLFAEQGSTGSGSFALATSPALTGNPTAPTQAAESNDTKVATDEYVDRALRNIAIKKQSFTASGTYTPDSKLIYCVIEAWGGGAGGGGTGNTAAGVEASGAGGGAGGYSRTIASRSDVGASQTVTVGSLGTGGAAGNNAGNAGGSTSVGTLCVANGGSGGNGNPGSASAIGGAGGAAGTGDLTGTGESGFNGEAFNGSQAGSSGEGGSAPPVGRGGRAVNGAQTSGGFDATGRASGGGGGKSFNGAGARNGGNGTAGYVFITEFCYG